MLLEKCEITIWCRLLFLFKISRLPDKHFLLSLGFILYFTAAANISVGLQSGILVAVPVPDQYAAAAEPVEAAIQTSLKELK